MSALPGQKIVARNQIVGVLYGLCGNIDDRERRHQLIGGNLFGRDTGVGKMNRRVEMRAGMLDKAPTVDVVAVLLELTDPLHFDSRAAVEGRKSGRHHMGEVEDGLEFSRHRRTCRWRGRGSEGQCRSARYESASRERVMQGFLTTGNAHDGLPDGAC